MCTWRQWFYHSWSQFRRRPLPAIGILLLVAGLVYFCLPRTAADSELDKARSALNDLDLTEAKNLLEAHLHLRPEDGDAMVLLARAYRLLGRFPAAGLQLQKAEKAGAPATDIVLEKLLLKAQQTGDLTDDTAALQSYMQPPAVEGPLVFQALAMGAHRLRSFDRANNWLTLWVERYPNDWLGRFQRALFFQNIAQWGWAQREFEYALALRPDHAETHHGLGQVLAKSGHDYGEAIRHLEFYLHLHPDTPVALSALAHSQRTFGKLEEADATLRRLVALQPDNVDGLILQAQLAIDREQYADALISLQRAEATRAATVRETATMTGMRARVHRQLGQIADAELYETKQRQMEKDVRELDRAVQDMLKNSQDVSLRRRLGMIYLRLGNLLEAQQWLDPVLKEHPDDPEINQGFADYYARQPDADAQSKADLYRRRAAGGAP